MADITKARPIIMQAESVRATLADLKTQTRRVIVPSVASSVLDYGEPRTKRAKTDWQKAHSIRSFWNDAGKSDRWWTGKASDRPGCIGHFLCPFGKIGDLLYFKEAIDFIDRGTLDGRCEPTIIYLADKSEVPLSHLMQPEDAAIIEGVTMRPVRRNAIFMWRWAARVIVEITDVRAERVSDISEADARAEGVADVAAYRALWDGLNAKRGHPWSAGDWVWALTYRRVVEGVGIK
jgi:hypothetical protein